MRKLTEEQKKKLYNNLAIFLPLIELILQIFVMAVPFSIYGMTRNWAYIILYIGIQIGIMPVILMIGALGGLIFSILALQKICFRKRYIVMFCLSGLEFILSIVLFQAMGTWLGIG